MNLNSFSPNRSNRLGGELGDLSTKLPNGLLFTGRCTELALQYARLDELSLPQSAAYGDGRLSALLRILAGWPRLFLATSARDQGQKAGRDREIV